MFNGDEVRALAARRGRPPRVAEGALAAMLFDRFKRGATLDSIVSELKQPPQVVRRFYNEWKLTLDDSWALERRRMQIDLQRAQQLADAEEERRQQRAADREARRLAEQLGLRKSG